MWLIKILCLCVIPSFLGCCLLEKVCKYKLMIVNMTATVFLMSAAESILGRYSDSILDDLIHISFSHVIWYAIAALMAVIIIDILLKLLFKADRDSFIDLYLALISIMLLPLMIFAKVTNVTYCLIAVLAMSLGMLFFKIKISLFKFSEEKNIFLAIATSALYGFMMHFFNPNELFASNYDDISVHWGTFILWTGIFCVLAITLYAIFLLLLPDILYYPVCVCLFLWSLCCYIQGNFLNGILEKMDGGYQKWTLGQLIGNIVIWLMIISISMVIGFFVKKKHSLAKIVVTVSVYIILIQLLSIVYIEFTASYEQKCLLTIDNQLTLDDQNNVIVFTLDWFDTQIMDNIELSHPDFLDEVSDFTYYKNCSSLYFYTAMEIPYLLTGIECPEGYYRECREYCFDNSELIEDIRNEGYSIGVYTGASYIPDSMIGTISNYKRLLFADAIDYSQLMKITYKSSLYKCTPYILKNIYSYSDYEYDAISANNQVYNTFNDTLFGWDVIDKGITIDESLEGAYRFYHLRATHPPLNKPESVEEDALTYMGMQAFDIVYNYIYELKENGIYDSSTIIIMADHGQNYLDDASRFDQTGLTKNSSNPICFVKLPFEKSNEIITNNVAVTQREIVQTIANSLNLEKNYTGTKMLNEVREGDYADRYAYLYDIDNNGADSIWFKISGDVRDWNNWSVCE